jgi:hypothetical protein
VLLGPGGNEQPDAFGRESPRGEPQDRCRGLVEPLDIVHRDKYGLSRGKKLQRRERCQTDHMLSNGRAFARLEGECHLECAALRLWKLGKYVFDVPREKIAQRGE